MSYVNCDENWDAKAKIKENAKKYNITMKKYIKYNTSFKTKIFEIENRKKIDIQNNFKEWITMLQVSNFLPYRFVETKSRLSWMKIVYSFLTSDKYFFDNKYVSHSTQRTIEYYLDNLKLNDMQIDEVLMLNVEQTMTQTHNPYYIVFKSDNITYVSIRATITNGDIKTDFDFKPTSIEGISKDESFYAHQGFLIMAKKIIDKLQSKNLLSGTVMFTGQSMGASLAAICTFLCVQKYQTNAKAFCFGPAPCLSLNACKFLYHNKICTSFVMEADPVCIAGYFQIKNYFRRIQLFNEDYKQYLNKSQTDIGEEQRNDTDLFLPGLVTQLYKGELYEIQPEKCIEFYVNMINLYNHINYYEFEQPMYKLLNKQKIINGK